MTKMDDVTDLCIPDVPLAKIEDDMESNASTIDKDEHDQRRNLSGGSNGENLAVSLEDLVENFDQNVNKVLKDMSENTTQMAPVQVRSQDEIMSESQVWWTLTGQYGTILPLDFNKTQIRRNQIEALQLDTPRALPDEGILGGAEEEDLRQNMDLHQMISEQTSINHESLPVSADQVIEEIDEMMQTHDLIRSMTTDRATEFDSMYSSMRSPFIASQAEADLKLKHHEAISLTDNELSGMAQSGLLALSSEMEQLIMVHNSDLVSELARRDELEYEKEIKNKFITLLVNIQDQRRRFQAERKKKGKMDLSQMPQFATAVIPFDDHQPIVNVPTLESLIKILEAINENNPQVPTLLTDYILTVVCPSSLTA